MATGSNPQTLRAAHEVAMARRPAPDADLSTWLTFHRSNARMYEAVAGIDRFHHHSALYWADYERRQAGEFSARIEAKQQAQ